MNATSQVQHWSQQLASGVRNSLSGANVRAPNLPLTGIETERQRYEAERRIALESEQNRQYMNALSSSRYGNGGLPPPPAHSSITRAVSSVSSQLPSSPGTVHSSAHASNSISFKGSSRNDPGPPPPLMRTDGTPISTPAHASSKSVHDPRYGQESSYAQP